jgi:hypothetical protein
MYVSLPRDFDRPGKVFKHGQQRQVQMGAQGTAGWSHPGPMLAATLSRNVNKTTILEATDDKVQCSMFVSSGSQ